MLHKTTRMRLNAFPSTSSNQYKHAGCNEVHLNGLVVEKAFDAGPGEVSRDLKINLNE